MRDFSLYVKVEFFLYIIGKKGGIVFILGESIYLFFFLWYYRIMLVGDRECLRKWINLLLL